MKRSALLRYLSLGTGAAVVLPACNRLETFTSKLPLNAASSPEEPALSSTEAVSISFPLEETWKVATTTGYYPFVQQPQPDQFEGFDVDLLSAIATVAGVELQWQKQSFDSLIPLLQGGRADVAIGALAITEARAELVSFSEPYFMSGLAIATPSEGENGKNFKALEDTTIAVQLGTAGAQAAVDIPGSTIKTYSSAFAALQAVVDGAADAAITDFPLILSAISSEQITGIQLASKRLTREPFGIAVPNKKSDSLVAINQALAIVRENGQYGQIYQKWFGVEPG
ncbi:MAG: transporter substrate-binding domain-containing protein [Cyanobacteria bacterium P01_A01_bin.114]